MRRDIIRFLAGTVLAVVFLLGTFSLPLSASSHAAGTEYVAEAAGGQDTKTYEDASGEDASEEGDEESGVLGAQREDNNDKFIICVETAICIIFAVGLIAAGKGGYEN